jgi:5'-3' exonuclease
VESTIGTRKLLLVDINILGFGAMRRRAYAGRIFSGRPTGAIHGTLEQLLTLVTEFDDHVPIVLWDDRCRWREELLPRYKRHRWATPEQQAFLASYLGQAEVVRRLLGHLGVPQVFCPGFEADDLAGAICRGIDADWDVVLATSDTDWLQALRERVTWRSLHTGLRITVGDLDDPERVKGGPFDSTDHYLMAKALAGDAADGIPGVVGVGLKTAARIIRAHGSVEALWDRHDRGEPINGAPQQRAAGPDYREAYRRNLRLIDWRLAPPLAVDFRLQVEPANRDAYDAECAACGMTASMGGLAIDRRDAHATAAAVAAVRRILDAAAGAGARPSNTGQGT